MDKEIEELETVNSFFEIETMQELPYCEEKLIEEEIVHDIETTEAELAYCEDKEIEEELK